ncbi:EVE domain-containing protein [Anabaena catenula]|uniref:EVE domain-containing protein n=1 Tax=Anabaena catenula TaxID=1296320 RepID=UPI0018EF72F4|nr:EVE domain-containing protein [Anabaena catenula]
MTRRVDVNSSPYADPTSNDSKLAAIDLRAVRRVTQPITLSQIKQDSHFTDFDLVRLPRLYVVPVSDFHWQHLIDLAENIN